MGRTCVHENVCRRGVRGEGAANGMKALPASSTRSVQEVLRTMPSIVSFPCRHPTYIVGRIWTLSPGQYWSDRCGSSIEGRAIQQTSIFRGNSYPDSAPGMPTWIIHYCQVSIPELLPGCHYIVQVAAQVTYLEHTLSYPGSHHGMPAHCVRVALPWPSAAQPVRVVLPLRLLTLSR